MSVFLEMWPNVTQALSHGLTFIDFGNAPRLSYFSPMLARRDDSLGASESRS